MSLPGIPGDFTECLISSFFVLIFLFNSVCLSGLIVERELPLASSVLLINCIDFLVFAFLDGPASLSALLNGKKFCSAEQNVSFVCDTCFLSTSILAR